MILSTYSTIKRGRIALKDLRKLLQFPSNCMLDCGEIEEFTGYVGPCLNILPIIMQQTMPFTPFPAKYSDPGDKRRSRQVFYFGVAYRGKGKKL